MPPASQGVKFREKRFFPELGFRRVLLGHSRQTLDADDLLERVHDFDEVGLVRHHAVDILVRCRDFVEHALVLAAFDAPGLLPRRSAREKRRFASARLMRRPAPCAQEQKDSGLPLPRTM